jgi:hypothetical protein
VATVFEEAKAASAPPDLVEISRDGLTQRPLRGFAVGASSQLVLLQFLSDRLDLDGYAAFPLRDVTALNREFPKKAFCLKALELKRCRPEVPAGIDLSGLPALLRSIEQRYPLVVIQREKVVPDECEIGRIKMTSENTYALRWITPTATWADDDETYRYADITRVGFGGEYENTLALVAATSLAPLRCARR